jgi:hypothetical protein
MGHIANLSYFSQYYNDFLFIYVFSFVCGHNKQFHVTCKRKGGGFHCLGILHACTCDFKRCGDLNSIRYNMTLSV